MIATEWLVEVDKKLYFKSRYIPGTFCYDISDNTTRFIAENRDVKVDFMPYEYWQAVKYKDYVIFPPFFGKEFTIYNIKNEKITYINKRQNYVYRAYKMIDNKCFFFTSNPSEITILEENEGEFLITYPSDGVNDCTSTKITTSDECSFVGDNIVHATTVPNKLIKYNVFQNRYEEVELDIDGMVVYTVHFDGERVWLTGDKPIIYIVDKDLEFIVKKIDLPQEHYKENKMAWKFCFLMGVITNNYIFYAPVYYKAVVRVNLQTLEVDTIMPIAENMYSWGINYVSDTCIHLNLVKDEKEHWSYFINYDGEIVQKDVFKLSNGDSYWRANPILQESKFISLKSLLTNE